MDGAKRAEMHQDEAITRATKDSEAGIPDADVGMEVHPTMREHHGQGRNGERVMWSHEDLRRSAYSEVNIDAWVKPMEGKHETEGDDMPRCLGRGDDWAEGGTYEVCEGWYPTCNRSGRESNWRTHTANKGRAIGSTTL